MPKKKPSETTHKDKKGEYIWEVVPTRYLLKIPWRYSEPNEDCGHMEYWWGKKGIIPTKWGRRKFYIIEYYNLNELIETISPVPNHLMKMLDKSTKHLWEET